MQYIPLNNEPNVSVTRDESISPSLQIDSRGYPHVVWQDKGEGRNKVKYSFWDGLQWTYENSPDVHISEEEIVSSPNSFVFDSRGGINESPAIALSRKSASGSILSLATYSSRWYENQWNFSELNVDYDVGWIGVIRYDRNIEFSSSSSSSSSSIDSSSSSSSSQSVSTSSSSSSSSSSTSISSSSSSSSSPEDTSSSSGSVSSHSSSSSSSLDSSSSSSSSSSSVSSESSISSSSSSSSSFSSSSSSSSSSLSLGMSSSSSSSLDTSSSSSSSYNDAILFVVVYDETNSEFKVYAVSDIWRLIGFKSASVDTYSSIKIDDCGRKLGISFINDSAIEYNFFDLDYELWSFNAFRVSLTSQLYGDVMKMDMGGYNVEDQGLMSVGWLSRTSTTFYVNAIYISDEGVELEYGTSVNVESSDIDVTTSSDYIVNGYNEIAICLNSNNYPRIFVAGSESKLLTYTPFTWTESLVDIEGIGNGILFDSLQCKIDSGDVDIVFSSNSEDIYYFEPDSSSGFSVSTPDVALLTNTNIFHADYSEGALVGSYISGTSGSNVGDVLTDTKKPVLVAPSNDIIKTVDLNQDSIITNRNVANDKWISSVDVNQITGDFIVTEPLNDDGSYGGQIILYPQSLDIEIRESTSWTRFNRVGDLYYPLDARFDYVRNKFWVADTGDNIVFKIDIPTEDTDVIIENTLTYPHALVVNPNDGSIFVKGYTDVTLTNGIVYHFRSNGEVISSFQFNQDDVMSSSSSSSSNGLMSSSSSSGTLIPSMPSTRSIAYDHVRSRCWWIDGDRIYMVDVGNQQVNTYDITADSYSNPISVDIEVSTGNAFVVAQDASDNWVLIQMFRDNNSLLSEAYIG